MQNVNRISPDFLAKTISERLSEGARPEGGFTDKTAPQQPLMKLLVTYPATTKGVDALNFDRKALETHFGEGVVSIKRVHNIETREPRQSMTINCLSMTNKQLAKYMTEVPTRDQREMDAMAAAR